jgi:hypothetical protein
VTISYIYVPAFLFVSFPWFVFMCSERGEWDVVVALVVLVHARGCVVDVSVQRGMPFRVFDFDESGGLVGLLVRYHSGCIW